MSTEDNTCSICLEGLRNPRELPCHHSFCESCLQEFIDNLAENGKVTTTFDCPNCRKPTSPPTANLPTTTWASQFPQFPKETPAETPKHMAIIRRKCNPCQYDEQDVTATRYCTDCREYLCEDCYVFHKKVSVTRKHKVIKAEELNLHSDEKSSKERCPCRWNKTLKFYCPGHDTFCCSNCNTENHESCRNVTKVVDMSEDIRFYGEVDKYLRNLDQLQENFRKSIGSFERNKSSLESEKSDIIKTIKKMNADLKSMLDRIETSMIAEVNRIQQQCVDSLTDRIEKCTAAIREVETSVGMMKATYEKENDQLAIPFKRVQIECNHYVQALQEITEGAESMTLCFRPSQAVQDFQEKLKTFGKFETHVSKNLSLPNFLPRKPLNIRSAEKRNSVKISDKQRTYSKVMELPDRRLVVVEHEHGQVLMVNPSGKWLSTCNVVGAWDVAVTADNELALTTTDQKKIQFLSIDNGLIRSRIINTDRDPWGVAFCRRSRELVITTNNPTSVQIMTIAGHVVKTIEMDRKGRQMFSRFAKYLGTNDMASRIYVSDRRKGVICVDRDGAIKFTNKSVSMPRGISTDGEGNVYVCDEKSSAILQLSADGIKTRLLLPSVTTLYNQLGLYFNRRYDTLLLSSANESKRSNEVWCFEMV